MNYGHVRSAQTAVMQTPPGYQPIQYPGGFIFPQGPHQQFNGYVIHPTQQIQVMPFASQSQVGHQQAVFIQDPAFNPGIPLGMQQLAQPIRYQPPPPQPTIPQPLPPPPPPQPVQHHISSQSRSQSIESRKKRSDGSKSISHIPVSKRPTVVPRYRTPPSPPPQQPVETSNELESIHKSLDKDLAKFGPSFSLIDYSRHPPGCFNIISRGALPGIPYPVDRSI